MLLQRSWTLLLLLLEPHYAPAELRDAVSAAAAGGIQDTAKCVLVACGDLDLRCFGGSGTHLGAISDSTGFQRDSKSFI